jgi:UDP-N-acetylglucosamine acyltransferase
MNYISKNAIIGENIKIGFSTVINDDVIIGNNVEIGANVLIDNGARISDNVKISHGAVVSAPPQHITDSGENTLFEIGENTVIREYVTLNRGTKATGKTTLGKNCYLMSYSHIGHDCRVGDNVNIANATSLGGHCEIGENVFIGGLVALHQFVKVGSFVIISGGYGTSKDIPPYVKVGGVPLKFKGLNLVGLRRRNFSSEQIKKIGDVYHILYNAGLNISDAVKKIKSEYELKDESKIILDFIESSKRGIIRN